MTIPADVPVLNDAVTVVRGAVGTAPDAQGMLVGPSDRVGRAELARMPLLRVVAVAGSGTDAVDVAALHDRGIRLVSAATTTAATTAELTMCLVLMVSRGVPHAIAELTEQTWTGWSFDHVVGRGLQGLTIGLVGYGRIARKVAELASAFGMEIRHHARHDTRIEGYMPSLTGLLATSDVVSLHVPLTADTEGFIGRDEIGAMRPGAALINTSRGRILDELALIEALEEGRLSGAGLDVFAAEPAIPHRLLAAPNLLITPHIGTSTATTRDAMAREASEELLKMLRTVTR